jgi:hypothetical protein
MAVFSRPLLFILLAIRFSTCYAPQQLSKEFSYEIPKDEVLDRCKNILISLDYKIDIYAPESALLVTQKKRLKHSFRRYDYAVVVIVSDKIKVFLSVEKWAFNRGSELSTSGEKLYRVQSEDILPEKLQNQVFQPIVQAFQKQNFFLVSP